MNTNFVERPDGRIAYDIQGQGPLVVMVPGMGDLRSTYRYLAPAITEAGFTVVTTDLRGHGESDSTFRSYGDVETADDVVALLEHLDQPAVLMGNSMSAGSVAYLAAIKPELVRGLVLVGPFVRNGDTSAIQRLMLRAAMAPAWAAQSWRAYLPKLYAGTKPADLDSHISSIFSSIKRPGYAASFSLTTRTSHAPVEAVLGQISAPALVVMGELDPDFKDPKAEAQWIAERLVADVAMVPHAGHYPHAQHPEIVTPAVLGFLSRLSTDA